MKAKTKLKYIEDYPMDKIKPYGKNPRINDQAVPAVSASMDDFGNNDPIQITPEGIILAGHTRYKALTKKGVKTARVIVVEGLNDEEQKAYRLAHNKVGEIAEWDAPMLMEELGGIEHIDMEELGFGEGEIIDTGEPIDVQEDDFDEETDVNEHGVKRGDVWQLGEHRLMCGDSSDHDDTMTLTGGEDIVDMVFTDPPYNVAIGDKNKWLEEYAGARYNSIKENIIGDAGMTDEEIGHTLWLPAFKNMLSAAKDECAIYVTMPQGGTHMMMMMMNESGWQVKHELIWVKNCPTFSMGRLDYDYQHEPICFGWNKSHKKIGKGKFTKSIWEIDKPQKSALHPTMKPIELISNAIQNSSESGDTILDLFGGSGSTLIACEETGRRCLMMELDPHYCDVIISRWEQFTGKTAVKVER